MICCFFKPSFGVQQSLLPTAASTPITTNAYCQLQEANSCAADVPNFERRHDDQRATTSFLRHPSPHATPLHTKQIALHTNQLLLPRPLLQLRCRGPTAVRRVASGELLRPADAQSRIYHARTHTNTTINCMKTRQLTDGQMWEHTSVRGTRCARQRSRAQMHAVRR